MRNRRSGNSLNQSTNAITQYDSKFDIEKASNIDHFTPNTLSTLGRQNNGKPSPKTIKNNLQYNSNCNNFSDFVKQDNSRSQNYSKVESSQNHEINNKIISQLQVAFREVNEGTTERSKSASVGSRAKILKRNGLAQNYNNNNGLTYLSPIKDQQQDQEKFKGLNTFRQSSRLEDQSKLNSMSNGSKFIIENKLRENQQREEEVKRKCLDAYGSNNNNQSMIDMYIRNQNKQTYFTPSIQRFEDSILTQMRKIQESSQQKNENIYSQIQSQNNSSQLQSYQTNINSYGKQVFSVKSANRVSNTSLSNIRGSTNRGNNNQTMTGERAAKTGMSMMNSRANEKNIKHFDDREDNEDQTSKQNTFIIERNLNLRSSHSHIYYSGGIPKTLLNKKEQQQSLKDNQKQLPSNSNHTTQSLKNTYATNFFNNRSKNINNSQLNSQNNTHLDQAINKDKLSYARSKWMQKHGIQVLMMQSKESEDESRRLFRYIDYNNDGLITRQQLKMFIKFIEEEIVQDSSIFETNQILKQLRKLTNQPKLQQVNEDQFSYEMTKLQENYANKIEFNISKPSNIQDDSTKMKKEAVHRDNLQDLLAMDAELLEKKLKQDTRNLNSDTRFAIEQARQNFERGNQLKIRLDQVIQKCQEIKTITSSNLSSIQVKGQQNISDNNSGERVGALNIQSKNIQNNTFEQIREQELRDLNTLFRKLTTQLDRYDVHLQKLSKMNEIEMLEFKLKQFGVQLNQVQKHIKEEEQKLTIEAGINKDPQAINKASQDPKEDLNYKQLKSLNEAINRKAVMNQIAEEFQETADRLERKVNKGSRSVQKQGKSNKNLKNSSKYNKNNPRIDWEQKMKNQQKQIDRNIEKSRQNLENSQSIDQNIAEWNDIQGVDVSKSDHTKTGTIMSNDQDQRNERQENNKYQSEGEKSFTSSCDSESEDDQSKLKENERRNPQNKNKRLKSSFNTNLLTKLTDNQYLITKRRVQQETLNQQSPDQNIYTKQSISNNHTQELEDASNIFRIEDESSFQNQINYSKDFGVINQNIRNKAVFLVREVKPQVNSQLAVDKIREQNLKKKQEEEIKNQKNKIAKVSTQFILETHQDEEIINEQDIQKLDITQKTSRNRRLGKTETQENFLDSTKGELWIFRAITEQKIEINQIDQSTKTYNLQTFEVQQFKNKEFIEQGIHQITLSNDKLLVLTNKRKLLMTDNQNKNQLKQVQELDQYKINAVGVNEQQILISYNEGKILNLKERVEHMPQLSIMKKDFKKIQGSHSFFIGQLQDDDIYQIGFMQMNIQKDKLPPQKQVLYYEKVNFPILSVKITQVSLGDCHAIALTQDFKAYTWGSNSHYQLAYSTDEEFVKHPHQINYYNQVSQVCAYGNSTAILDELNNLLTSGDNYYGQLGQNEDIEISQLLQRANKDLIIEEIVMIRGQGNTFSFLTKSQEIYVCGEFNIPIEGKSEFKKGKEYFQRINKPMKLRFLFDKKIRYKIKNYEINSNNLVLLTDIDPFCSKIKLT